MGRGIKAILSATGLLCRLHFGPDPIARTLRGPVIE